MILKSIKLCLIGVLILGLVACGRTKPSSFYILTPLPFSQTKPTSHGSSGTVGIGPVKIAAYLNKSQIATRQGINEIHLAEYHRWAEPLPDNIQSVLVANLNKKLSTWHVTNYPWRRSLGVNWQVRIIINQFDADSKGIATLNIRWKIFNAKKETLRYERHRIYHVRVDQGKAYSAIAASMSQALADASTDIASDIQRLRGKRAK